MPDKHGWMPIESAPKDGTHILMSAEEMFARWVAALSPHGCSCCCSDLEPYWKPVYPPEHEGEEG